MQNFIIEPLAKTQIAAAFPLIREALPDLDDKAWRRLARRLTDPRRAKRRGILVARRDARRHASGLFCYRKEQDLRFGAVLVADHFVALDLLDPRPVLLALIGALERLAKELGCCAIRSIVHAGGPDLGSDLTRQLLAAGHRLEGATLCKTLAQGVTYASASSVFPLLIAETCDADPQSGPGC